MADTLQSINPATEELLRAYQAHSAQQVAKAVDQAQAAYEQWRRTSFGERGKLMGAAAAYLRGQKARLAGLITAEMGKPIIESEGEVEKCAWNCDYYGENAERFLKDEPRPSAATESYIEFVPLGVVLAIMPWNFPLWQVFRFAAPALMAGNTAVLKHASNVPQCALAIEEVFRETGFPSGVFTTLLISGQTAEALIENPIITAVTLTGSEGAGSHVASRAGKALKKTVLELGGSDPFIVLEDADLQGAAAMGVRARYQNTGQSCIAAKRFIVVERVFNEFRDRFVEQVKKLKIGNPAERTTQIGPLARADLLDALERQVQESVKSGAKLLCGGSRRPGRGYYFEPAVLDSVRPDQPAACEEVFGPVAALMKVRDAAEAVPYANSSAYGLGANLWTRDIDSAKKLAREIEAGQVFINGMVASDPRLPFGGVKRSGYGRELSEFGIREFVNIQTVWIGPVR